MKIFIVCLKSYNNGIIHGKWIDVKKTLKEIRREVRNILAISPLSNCEEWAIHDYDGFGDLKLGEQTPLEKVKEAAHFLEEHGIIAEKLLCEFNMDVDYAKSALEDCYLGCYTSVADYARDSTESRGDLPDHLKCYIDYDLMGRDMLLNYDIYSIEAEKKSVYLFLHS